MDVLVLGEIVDLKVASARDLVADHEIGVQGIQHLGHIRVLIREELRLDLGWAVLQAPGTVGQDPKASE